MIRPLIFLLLCCSALSIKAQNAAPTLSNLLVTHDVPNQSVTFAFDVNDAEGDPVDLQLRVSADSGRTWLVALDSLTGDTGFPITPGNGKSIVWVYDPADLAGLYGPGQVAFQGRVIADDRMPVDIQDIVDLVDSARIVERLQILQGVRHRTGDPAHLQASRDSIAAWMAAAGLQDWHYDFSQFSFNGRNMNGRQAGLLRERRTWLASGHYDSVIGPGTDDNGTGTVGTLEAAAVLSDFHFSNSLRYINFDLEEEGLIGSIHHVLSRVEPWEDYAGLLNMEMIGYKDDAPNTQSLPAGFNILFPAAYQAVASDSFRGNFLTNVANTASDPLRLAFDSCAAAYVPDLRVISLAVAGNGIIAPDLRRSDHAPFWDGGYQALMLTDGANLRNPYYHTAGDTLGTLDLSFLVQNVKAVTATLAKMAQPLHADVAVGSAFVLDVPVGLGEGGQKGRFTVYPNPSKGEVKIEFSGWGVGAGSMRIVDATGKTVHFRDVAGDSGFLHWNGKTQNGEAISSGNYWIVMEKGEMKATRAFRIQK